MASAAAAEITYGEPVQLEFGEAGAILGAESRDGRPVVVLILDGAGCDDEGRGFAHVALSPEQAQVLADVLAGLAKVGS